MLQMHQRWIGEVSLAITGVTLPMAWLADLDLALRIVLTCVGIVAGVYSALYYRRKLKE